MPAATDDLTRPLGTATVQPAQAGRPGIWWVGGSVALLAVASFAVAFAMLFGDERGGVPYQRIAIGAQAPDRPDVVPGRTVEPADAKAAARPDRRNAGEVEVSSGVSVVRGGGAAPPDAVIVRVPDATELRPADPDGKLLEKTRFGLLPRIGPTGLKPLDAYARPAGDLPGGAVPVGRIALVVGGVGIGQSATAATLARLPPAVTLAIAPYGSDLEGLARRAREGGHEVMLQVPMEPFDYPDSDPGPHTLTVAAKPADNIDHLNWALGRFTGYVGIVNFMGGKVTADLRTLQPIVREVAGRGLAFLDDGSSSRSVVTAAGGGMRSGRADAVVDAVPRADAIDRALERLEAVAVGGRAAIGTASALPLSIERIARWADGLAGRGILLVPVTTALREARDTASR